MSREHVHVVVRADRLDRVERAAAGEDGEPREQRPLGPGEEPVAPVQRRAQRLLAGRKIARAAGQELERLLEPPRHRVGRQQAAPGRGELDRQRQAVQPAADLGHVARTLVRELEGGIDCPCPRDEEPHGVVRRQLLEGRRAPNRESEAAEPDTHARRRASAARGSSRARAAVGAAASNSAMNVAPESSCSRLSSTRSMLVRAETLGDDARQRLLALLEPESVRDRRAEERRVLNRREVDERRTVAKAPARAPRLRPERAASCPSRPGL